MTFVQQVPSLQQLVPQREFPPLATVCPISATSARKLVHPHHSKQDATPLPDCIEFYGSFSEQQLSFGSSWLASSSTFHSPLACFFHTVK